MTYLKKGIIGHDGVGGSGSPSYSPGNVVRNAGKSFSDPESKEELKKKNKRSIEKAKREKVASMDAAFGKSVPMGRVYDQPLPMPMLASGLPDWEAPDLMSYVLFNINNEKSNLHGRSVVLQRMANGLYRIASESYTKHPEDRDKDIAKLRKEGKDVPNAPSKKKTKKTFQKSTPAAVPSSLDNNRRIAAQHQAIQAFLQDPKNQNSSLTNVRNTGTFGGNRIDQVLRVLPTNIKTAILAGRMDPRQLDAVLKRTKISSQGRTNEGISLSPEEVARFSTTKELRVPMGGAVPRPANSLSSEKPANTINPSRQMRPIASPPAQLAQPAQPVQSARPASPSGVMQPKQNLQMSLRYAVSDIEKMIKGIIPDTDRNIVLLKQRYSAFTLEKAMNIVKANPIRKERFNRVRDEEY